MLVRAHGGSSFLAILGGALFLVLPFAFLAGAVSVFQEIGYEVQCTSGVCRGWVFPMPDNMALYLIILGMISVFLGFLVQRLEPRPRTGRSLGLSLGVVFLLGMISLLSGINSSQIQATFITDPQGFLVFPDLSVVLMVGATVVFVYELLRARFSLPLTREEANARR